MPFQQINFAGIKPIGRPWLRDLIPTLMQGYAASQMPGQMQRQAQQEQLANAMAQLKLQQEPQQFQADITGKNLGNAFQSMLNQEQPQKFQTQMTSDDLANAMAKMKNQFYPALTKSQIDSNKALATNRSFGGSALGVGGKEEQLFQHLVAMDNPQLDTPQKIYEAANVLRNGGNTLSDGTKLNSMSPAAKSSFDRLAKYGTTASLITGGIKGKQADTEIDVLSKFAQEGIKPYGNTILGYSPKQIEDTFKSDDVSQTRLGKGIAAKALQYEIAQNRIKLGQGQPGVNSTQELIDLSQQNIKTAYPRLSAKARQEASDYLTKALKEANKARQTIGIGASGATQVTPQGQANLLRSGIATFAPTGSNASTNSNDPLGWR